MNVWIVAALNLLAIFAFTALIFAWVVISVWHWDKPLGKAFGALGAFIFTLILYLICVYTLMEAGITR